MDRENSLQVSAAFYTGLGGAAGINLGHSRFVRAKGSHSSLVNPHWIRHYLIFDISSALGGRGASGELEGVSILPVASGPVIDPASARSFSEHV